MKAEHLRIGSWVYEGEKYGDCQVTAHQIDHYRRGLLGSPVAEYYKEWKPIPLDEEWLKRLGWTSEYTQKGVSIGAFSIETNEDKSLLDKGSYVVTTICGSFVIAWIDHVHQLQNLYFALTGKELNTIEHN